MNINIIYAIFIILLLVVIVFKIIGVQFNKLYNDYDLKSNEISMLSYNVFLIPFSNMKYSTYDEDRTRQLIQYIKNYDIVCLQEVYSMNSANVNTILNFCEKNGYNYYYEQLPSFISASFINSGLLTISKFKIYDHGFIPFNNNIGYDQLAEKGVLYTQIKINDKSVYIFNTHLQAFYKYPIPLEYKSVIREEVNHIVNNLKKVSKDNLVVLSGDFNIDNADLNMSGIMEKNGLNDVNTYNKNTTTLYYNNGSNDEILEYKPVMCKRSQEDIQHIDHYKKDVKIDYTFYDKRDIKLVESDVIDFEIKHPYLSHLSDHKAVYSKFVI